MTEDLSERTAQDRAMWNTRYAEKDFVWSVQPNRFLPLEAVDLKPARALDLAAGEARNAIWLAEQGWQVTAVDISDVGLEKGRKLAASRDVETRIVFETADLRTYIPEKRGFDLVILFYLHMRRDDVASIVRLASEAVAPGGTFLLVAHDASNLENGYGGPQSPDVLYSAEDVTAALDDGFSVEKAGTIDRPVETEAGTKVAIDCLVRARRD